MEDKKTQKKGINTPKNSKKTKKVKKTRDCPPKKPLFNPITNRCVMDTLANRRKIKGLRKKSNEPSVAVTKITDFVDFALLNTNEQITFIRENDTPIVDNIYNDLVKFNNDIDTGLSKNDTRNIDKQQVNSALEVLLGIIDNPERNPYEIKERVKFQKKYIPKPDLRDKNFTSKIFHKLEYNLYTSKDPLNETMQVAPQSTLEELVESRAEKLCNEFRLT